MANPQLTEYVKQERAAGTPDATIKNDLLQAGWQETDVLAALGIAVPSSIPTPHAPVQPAAIPSSPVTGQVLMSDPADVQKNKVIAILAYFIFFLPLISAKDSKFAMFHANQGLLVLFIWAIGWMASYFFYWYGLQTVLYLAALILTVIGIINASSGQMKPLPLIGSISIIRR